MQQGLLNDSPVKQKKKKKDNCCVVLLINILFLFLSFTVKNLWKKNCWQCGSGHTDLSSQETYILLTKASLRTGHMYLPI